MAFPSLSLSHLELYVRDLKSLEQFYTGCLGFVVTDRGEGMREWFFSVGTRPSTISWC